MRPFKLVLMLALVTWSVGCSDKNPTRPSGSVTAVTGLAITGADAVLTGLSASYAVTASLSDGTTRTVTPVWTSSNPGVASVDGGGRLDGRVHGSTSLTATYEGRSVSKTVQVVNNYGGTWEGRYVITACRDTGDLTDHDGGWCLGGPGRVGTVRSITMRLVQSGQNLSDITRTFPGYPETLTGVVTADGRLNLGGTVNERDFDYNDVILATVQFRAWDMNIDGNGGVTGGWSEDLTSFIGRRGTAHTENEVVTMSRRSSSVQPASAIH